MLVGPDEFNDIVKHLASRPELAFDTETTGLRPYHGDRLFCCIFHDFDQTYYFNFQDYPDENVVGLNRELIKKLSPIFSTNGPRLYIHNAKFDMHIMNVEGIRVENWVWCTHVMARILYNDYFNYSLAYCAERIGLAKDDAVEEYIKKHKLWEWVEIPGKKIRGKIKYYDKVPLRIMQKYGEQDASVCGSLAKYQIDELKKIHLSSPENKPTIQDIINLESMVTQVCFDIEKQGVLIDREYCLKGAEFEEKRAKKAEEILFNITGLKFVDSNKHLSTIFSSLGVTPPLTEKGNPSFPDSFLETLDSPVASAIRDHRDATKRGGTYFRGFLYWSDEHGRLHPDMRQGGTATGRFSYADPNLQNLTKNDPGEFKVRRCVIPDENYFFGSIDYDQMEFRLMLDYAGQLDLIKQIKEGYDPHTATSELVGIPRRAAKILNFGLLYGMGLDLLAKSLGVTREEAREFKSQYFGRLGRVKKFIRTATYRAESRGFVHDWLGRRFYTSDKRFVYKAANSIIQGGCSSIVKKAMNELDTFLEDKKSHMLIQIHDEILFNVHNDEKEILPELSKIMAEVYPFTHMPMSCSISTSKKNFHDMEDWDGAGI